MKGRVFHIKCHCDTCNSNMLNTELITDINEAYECRYQWILHTRLFPCEKENCNGYSIPIIYEFKGNKGWKKLED